jgi:hypothetical protein
VLLPYHLTAEQEKLVYTAEARAKLEAEPIEITLGDVTLPLEHLDRNVLPNRFKTFKEAVVKSETAADWENVVRMLEGMQNAGIKVKKAWQEMVIRQLNLHGMQHLVLKAIQRPKATGVRLSNWGVLVQVLRSVHDKAALANWEKEETIKALRLARQVVELMEDEEHCGGQARGEMKTEGDFRGKPVVVALPTELAAVLAEKQSGDKEEVKKMAGRLVNTLKQDGYMVCFPSHIPCIKPGQLLTTRKTELDAISQRASKTSADFSNKPKHLKFLNDYSYELLQLIIIWNALKTSRSVLDADMPMAEEAQQFEARVEQVLVQGVEAMDKQTTREGKELHYEYKDYIKDSVERCR